MLKLILFFSFITIAMLLFPVVKYLVGKQKAIFRLKRYISADEIREEKKKIIRKDYRTGFYIISKTIGNARMLDGYKKTIQMQLTRAHILLKSEEYITVCLILFSIFALLVFVITRSMPLSSSLLFAIAAGIAGWLAPNFVIKNRIKKRIKYLNEQLCDAISLISNSLKAGYSFFQSIDIVAKEMSGPIAEEFSLLQKEINLGLSTEKALENLVGRISSDDLELVVTAVLIQRQVGGNLSEVLDNISSTIRERIKLKGEVKTVTANGRMSGLIISLLPPILGFILYLINPGHISLLFTNPIGIAIVVFSVLMELIGIYFIGKIVKVEM